jgi:hypothetical protein
LYKTNYYCCVYTCIYIYISDVMCNFSLSLCLSCKKLNTFVTRCSRAPKSREERKKEIKDKNNKLHIKIVYRGFFYRICSRCSCIQSRSPASSSTLSLSLSLSLTHTHTHTLSCLPKNRVCSACCIFLNRFRRRKEHAHSYRVHALPCDVWFYIILHTYVR